MVKQKTSKKSGGYRQELSDAVALQRQGRLQEAEQRLLYVLARQPRNLQANHLLGLLYFQAREFQAAQGPLQKALQKNPADAGLHNTLGNVLRAQQQPVAALEHLRKAVAISSTEPRYIHDLAWALAETGELDAAIEQFQQALRREPDYPSAHVGLGCALRDRGDIAAAIEQFAGVCAQFPDMGDAQLYLAQLRDRSGAEFDAEVAAVEEAYFRAPRGSLPRADLGFAAAIGREQRGNYAGAFESLEEAHTILGTQQPFDKPSVTRYFEALAAAPLPESLTALSSGPRPVFVLGLPRSGTSLVEQVLASHSAVYGAGELRLIGDLCAQLEAGSEQPFAAAFAALDEPARQAMADDYRAALVALAPDAQWVVDKMPANYQAIGLIASLFPDAVILHCERDPMAVCWSIYKTRFAEPHPFANSLENLGFYHNSYLQLMRHWSQVLPGRVIDVSYEMLVQGGPAQIDRLLEALSLAPEAGCYNFHETRRAVRTASAAQVRKPLYTSALQQYEHYSAQLEPLRRTLDAQDPTL